MFSAIPRDLLGGCRGMSLEFQLSEFWCLYDYDPVVSIDVSKHLVRREENYGIVVKLYAKNCHFPAKSNLFRDS